jgi:Leucine-rich repeat (LRR) protein
MSLTENLGVHLPKLPRLDKEDLKAVRSSVPGKLLVRAAGLLWLALLVLGYAGAVDRFLKWLFGVDLSTMPTVHYALLFGLPMVGAASGLLYEWYAERSRRALQRLAVRVGAEQSGYFRIGPYLDAAEDRARFARADRAHEKVLDWIERSASLPLYLTGDSGSGKSSLLNASVLPALRERGWIIVEARAWQDPVAALRDALARLPGVRRPRQREKPAVRSIVEAAVRRAGAGLLLVLDQFEEFVILGKPEQKQEFAGLLADLRAISTKRLSLLLVLRSDYQTFLEDIGLPSLRHGENFYQVGRFAIAAARDFLERSGLELQPTAIDRLLDSAAELDETPGLVRPITLNVIGYVLAAGKAVAPSLDAGQLIGRYIEQTVRAPTIRDIAPRVLEQLVTEQSSKRPRSEQELAASTRLCRAEVRAVLNELGVASLARPLDPALGVWELSHDFVARAVARYLGRRRRDLLRRSGFFGAHALLMAILLMTIGVIAWNWLSLDQKLAEHGLTVTPTADGLIVERNSRLTSEAFARAGPLLARRTAVRSLDLSGTEVENLEPLKPLIAVRSLDLSGTKVENIQPLKGLTALQSLNLSQTRVRDLEPLKGLTALQSLNLRNTMAENIGPLKRVTGLWLLDLSWIHVGDFEPLKGLTALRALILSGSNFGNLELLRTLTTLQSLDLSWTDVGNLEPLRSLTELQSLDLSGNKVETLDVIKGLTALRSLELQRTTVANIEPLKHLTALRALGLSGTKVENLEPLKDLTALQALNLRETKVEILEPLRGLTALQWLDLSGTKVENLEPLKGLTALWFLDLSFKRVESLEPLKRLTALQVLSLVGTRVENLEAIEDLPALRKLYGPPGLPEPERRRFIQYREEHKLQPVEM